MDRNLLLIGGPDTGKTNYLARFWLALTAGQGDLEIFQVPQNIVYVEQAVSHLLQGEFAPHTSRDAGRNDFDGVVVLRAGPDPGAQAHLVKPDIYGEMWSNAVQTHQIDENWMGLMRSCGAALLFVRAMSPLNTDPLDWVTAAHLLSAGLRNSGPARVLPTQMVLCELLTFLRDTLKSEKAEAPPRIAVVVTAWDLLDAEDRASGPRAYIEREFPMMAGEIAFSEDLDIRVFGSSIVGGDLQDDEEFKARYRAGRPTQFGYVIFEQSGRVVESPDIALPVSWALRCNSTSLD